MLSVLLNKTFLPVNKTIVLSLLDIIDVEISFNLLISKIFNDKTCEIVMMPVLHDWCNKGCGMCYPVCGMVHIKEPLLLIDKRTYVAAAGFLSHYQNGP